MKKILIVLLALVSPFAFGKPGDAREVLSSVAGSDLKMARDLLKAIESNSMETVRLEMSKLVQQDKPYLVCIALRDQSDNIKLEAAKALASVKKKKIALAVLDASKDLEILVSGGTEIDGLRNRTANAFESTLISITGLRVEKAWSLERKRFEFLKKIEELPE